MNSLRLRQIADMIEQEHVTRGDGTHFKKRFDMQTWDCGTSACIGGFATAACSAEEKKKHIAADEFGVGTWGRYFVIGKGALGLTKDEANKLFIGSVKQFNDNKHLVPDALRWMAEAREINIAKGLEYARCVALEKARAWAERQT
jgi:hypothetical protein